MDTKEVALIMNFDDGTYHLSLGGVGILKLDADLVSKDQANEIYDQLCGVFSQGIELGQTLKQFDRDTIMEIFKSAYGVFEDAINMGIKASSAELSD